MFRVGGNGEQRFGGGAKEDGINRLFVLEGDLGDLFGDGEDDVKVLDRQQVGLPVSEPLHPLGVQTLGAVPVAAGVIGVASCRTVVAFFEVATEGRGTADLDGAQDTQLLYGERMSLSVGAAVLSKDVGHFKSGPGHPDYFRGLGFRLASASSGLRVPATTCGDTRV
jgi:hypothetical protein